MSTFMLPCAKCGAMSKWEIAAWGGGGGAPVKQGPALPDPMLIDSMAMRYRHDFGLLEEEEKEFIRITMRQIWEEVVGLGFYKARS